MFVEAILQRKLTTDCNDTAYGADSLIASKGEDVKTTLDRMVFKNEKKNVERQQSMTKRTYSMQRDQTLFLGLNFFTYLIGADIVDTLISF